MAFDRMAMSLAEKAFRLAAGATHLSAKERPASSARQAQRKQDPQGRRLSASSSDSSSLSELFSHSRGLAAEPSAVTPSATSPGPRSSTLVSSSYKWELTDHGELTFRSKLALAQLASDVLDELKISTVRNPASNASSGLAQNQREASRRNMKLKSPVNKKWNRTKRTARKPTVTKYCENCSTVDTPLWRRGPSKELLCNACALFLKHRGKPRPGLSVTDTSQTSAGFTRTQEMPDGEALSCSDCKSEKAMVRQEAGSRALCDQCWAPLASILLDQAVRRSSRKRRLEDEVPSKIESAHKMVILARHESSPGARKPWRTKKPQMQRITPIPPFNQDKINSTEDLTPPSDSEASTYDGFIDLGEDTSLRPLSGGMSLPPISTFFLPTPPSAPRRSPLPTVHSHFSLPSSSPRSLKAVSSSQANPEIIGSTKTLSAFFDPPSPQMYVEPSPGLTSKQEDGLQTSTHSHGAYPFAKANTDQGPNEPKYCSSSPQGIDPRRMFEGSRDPSIHPEPSLAPTGRLVHFVNGFHNPFANTLRNEPSMSNRGPFDRYELGPVAFKRGSARAVSSERGLM